MEGAGGTGGRKRTWLRCPWAVAWPGQTIHSTKASPVWRAQEGQAAVPVNGGEHRRAWLRCPWAVAWPGQTIHSTKASPVRRAPEGPEGMGGLRGAVPNEVRSPSLAGGRGLRRPEHPWSHKQPGPVTVSGPPPTGAPSSPAQQAPGTSAEPQQHGNRHHTNAPRHTKTDIRFPDVGLWWS